jgi:hypothetical protein
VGSAGGAVLFAVLAASGGRGNVVAAVVAGLLALLAWRMAMVGIRVRTDGVVIAATFLSRSVPWQDVDRFAVLPPGRFPYVGHVVLRNGGKLGTYGLSTSARRTESNRLRVQRPVDELNRILADRRMPVSVSH